LETYPIRIPEQYQELAFNELLLVNAVVNAILSIKWSEFKQKQEFKMRNESKVYIELGGYVVDDNLFQPFYLRNRFVRCVYEHVGRILRSIDERFEIYKYMVDNGFIEAIADDEPYEVYDLLKELYEKFNETLVDQEFKHLRSVVRRRFTRFKDKDIRNFFEITKPELRSYVLDFSADSDDQLCKITWNGTYLHIKLCVPKSPYPTKSSDWEWIEFKVRPVKKLLERLRQGYKLRKPRLIAKRVTNGRRVVFLEIVIEIPVPNIPREVIEVLKKNVKRLKRSLRILSVDLGFRKFATCVPIETRPNGELIQLSRPIFIRVNNKNNIIKKIERLLNEISRIQSKLDRLKPKSRKWRILYREFCRKWRKVRNIIYQVKHYVSTFIVRLALMYRCDFVIVGNFKRYRPIARFSVLSFNLSCILRGGLREYIEYKCKRVGITFVMVSEKGTSKTCPKCGNEGKLFNNYRLEKEDNKFGRVFYCPKCGYRADRDYVGALNLVYNFLKTFLPTFKFSFIKYLRSIPGSNASGESPSICVSPGSFLCYNVI